MRGGKRKNAGRKPGSSGIKKTKLKATEALKVTKGIRFMPEQIQRIEEAVRLSDAKNFSQFVVNASIKKADAILNELSKWYLIKTSSKGERYGKDCSSETNW